MSKQPVQIVLVEDNPYDAELTIRALSKEHLDNNLLHLEDGEKALNYLLKRGEFESVINDRPKLILLDLKLPKVSGTEVLQELKGFEETKNIPVVVLTSSKEDKDLKKCYELGVNSYIVKPVDFKKFIEVVKQLGLYWLVLNEIPDR